MICIVERWCFVCLVCCKSRQYTLCLRGTTEIKRLVFLGFVHSSVTEKICPNNDACIIHDWESCFSQTNLPTGSFYLSDRLSDITGLFSGFWFLQFFTGCADELFLQFAILELCDTKRRCFRSLVRVGGICMRPQLFSSPDNFYEKRVVADAGTVYPVLAEHFSVLSTARAGYLIADETGKFFCENHWNSFGAAGL